MANVQIRVLGISASPIKGGNCDVLVKETLKIAKGLGSVETKFVSLAGKKLITCRHCQWCIENMAPCRYKDEGDNWAINKEIVRSDGLILGSPVWASVYTPYLGMLLSTGRYINFFTHGWRNKVVGLLCVGYLGLGLDRALDTMRWPLLGRNMLVVAEGRVLSSTRVLGQKPAYLEHGVLDDVWGMRQAKMVAARVVEIARMVKYAGESGVTIPDEYKFTITGGKAESEIDTI